MKVYFAAAISNGREKLSDYSKIVDRFSENGCDVLTKHVSDPLLFANAEPLSPTEIYNRDYEWIKECDILFADTTIPSLGVGYEICLAEKLGKKVYISYENGADVSKVLKGNESFNVLPYNFIDEVLYKIDEISKQ